MTVELITPQDLQTFKADLLSEITQLLEGSKPHKKQWLRSAEVRQMLGISHGTLQNLRVNGTLPFTKIGGILFYPYEDVVKVLEQFTQNKPGNAGKPANSRF
jgi:hypothetical protein